VPARPTSSVCPWAGWKGLRHKIEEAEFRLSLLQEHAHTEGREPGVGRNRSIGLVVNLSGVLLRTVSG